MTQSLKFKAFFKIVLCVFNGRSKICFGFFWQKFYCPEDAKDAKHNNQFFSCELCAFAMKLRSLLR